MLHRKKNNHATKESIMDNGIDLLDDVSSFASRSRKRRHPSAATVTTDEEVICLEDSSPRATKPSGGSDVIDLSSPVLQNDWSRERSRTMSSTPIDVDDEIIEILSPAAAKFPAEAVRTAPTKLPILYDLSTSSVDRIREVFPLVSSQQVRAILAKASSYNIGTGDTDHATIQIVMSVLSEYPLGQNIPEEAFAAAAVGGNITTDPCDDDNDQKVAATTGKRKIAQLECNCCFVDYPFEEMVSCRSAGHLFCKFCLQKQTEQRVFGLGSLGVTTTNSNTSKALEILCMHSSGCTSGFHEWQLRKALPEKVLKKYDEMQFAAVIEQANTNGDISRCPKCNFIAFAETSLKTFHCPQCSFKSCRECGEEVHPGIRCDEVESKTETDARRNVEEAMTQALVRTCPRPFCRKKFLKTDGCNKMTCACGAFVCYVCRREIPKNVAYAHFCQTPHCNHKKCGKCALYANVVKDDEKRVQNAAKNAAKRQKTDVDVESLLKKPTHSAAAAAAAGRGHRGGRNWMQHQQPVPIAHPIQLDLMPDVQGRRTRQQRGGGGVHQANQQLFQQGMNQLMQQHLRGVRQERRSRGRRNNRGR